jgi:hypothetical protein
MVPLGPDVPFQIVSVSVTNEALKEHLEHVELENVGVTSEHLAKAGVGAATIGVHEFLEKSI